LTTAFEEFLASRDTLRVYHQGDLIFHSAKDRLQPLIEYIDAFVPRVQGVVVYDRVTGNAAALLLQLVGCAQVVSAMGSRLAEQTLQRYGITYQFTETVPHIVDDTGTDMCPMEKLSVDKTPEEFHTVLRNMMHITKPALRHTRN
jgi:hypothetical protein